MRAVVSAGGTGGHIYPALAIINKINEIEAKTNYKTKTYPRWLIRLICCFVPKSKNRKHLREKYIR